VLIHPAELADARGLARGALIQRGPRALLDPRGCLRGGDHPACSACPRPAAAAGGSSQSPRPAEPAGRAQREPALVHRVRALLRGRDERAVGPSRGDAVRELQQVRLHGHQAVCVWTSTWHCSRHLHRTDASRRLICGSTALPAPRSRRRYSHRMRWRRVGVRQGRLCPASRRVRLLRPSGVHGRSRASSPPLRGRARSLRRSPTRRGSARGGSRHGGASRSTRACGWPAIGRSGRGAGLGWRRRTVFTLRHGDSVP